MGFSYRMQRGQPNGCLQKPALPWIFRLDFGQEPVVGYISSSLSAGRVGSAAATFAGTKPLKRQHIGQDQFVDTSIFRRLTRPVALNTDGDAPLAI
jgi:hypothetical protein